MENANVLQIPDFAINWRVSLTIRRVEPYGMGSHTVQLGGMPGHQGQIGTEMDLKSYLKIIRNRWWLLLLGPVLAGAIAFYVSKQMTPTYATSATLLINQTQTPGTVQYNDILTSERLTNT